MVPAVTDLIVGMGARDRLVAVSTYDSFRSDVGQLPKAGNYDTVDWELLRSLHPSVLVTEIAPDRQSPGFKTRAAAQRIEPVNVKIETLADIFATIDELATALKEPALGRNAFLQMDVRLAAVQKLAAHQKPIPTLLVISPTADAVAGTGTYLDDLLKIAGGVNVIEPEMGHWPMIDREKLQSLKPDVILQLLPGSAPQERASASRCWVRLPAIPAVTAGRVYPIYDNYALLPGWHVTDLAETFYRCLHSDQPEKRGDK